MKSLREARRGRARQASRRKFIDTHVCSLLKRKTSARRGRPIEPPQIHRHPENIFALNYNGTHGAEEPAKRAAANSSTPRKHVRFQLKRKQRRGRADHASRRKFIDTQKTCLLLIKKENSAAEEPTTRAAANSSTPRKHVCF